MSGILGLGAYSDDEEENVPTQTVATTSGNGSATVGIAGLAAYEDSDDEQQQHSQPQQPQHPSEQVQLQSIPIATISDSSSSSSMTSSVAPPSAASVITARLNELLPPLTDSVPLSTALAQRHAANLQRREAMKSNPRAQPLVASLLKIKSFHNPAILSQIADKLHIDSFGSNLPAGLRKEQNLPEGKDEDLYEEIQKQVEATTAHRLATRTSIEFVPASSSSQPSTSSSMKNSTTAIVNADGSITRIRNFDASVTNASSTNPPQQAIARDSTSASDSSRPRKSKWGDPSADAEESRKRQKL